ncbi:MAG: hypothetical protein WB347_21355 [Terriglobales bacterium]
MAYRRVLTPEQQEARGINAVAELLSHRLIVPKIFLKPPWPQSRNRVDLLAVDRAGTGEIHIAEVKSGIAEASQSLERVKAMPAHYKYIAVIGDRRYRPTDEALYAADGFGRVGLIRIIEDNAGNLHAELVVAPERFRADPAVFKTIDRFTSKHRADIEIRP